MSGAWQVERAIAIIDSLRNAGQLNEEADGCLRAVVAAQNEQGEAAPVAWQFKAVANEWWSDCNEQTARTMQENPELWHVRPLFAAPPPPVDALAVVRRKREKHADDLALYLSYGGPGLGGEEAVRQKIAAADEIIRELEGGR